MEQHLEEFLRVYPERFAKQHGPLRAVVERVRSRIVMCSSPCRGCCGESSGADLTPEADARRIEARKGGGELVELARRFELIDAPEGGQHPMANLPRFCTERLYQA